MTQTKHTLLRLSQATLLLNIFLCNVAFAFSPARSMECDGHLVKVGASTSEVSELCGEPTDVTERREFRTTQISQPTQESPKGSATISQMVTSEILIEEWSYDAGPSRFVRRLTFENGRLSKILVGDYGVR